MDEDGSSLTHHAAWHTAKDLIAEHKKCHDALKGGRESRKRMREDDVGLEVPEPAAIGGGEVMVHQQEMLEQEAPQDTAHQIQV